MPEEKDIWKKITNKISGDRKPHLFSEVHKRLFLKSNCIETTNDREKKNSKAANV